MSDTYCRKGLEKDVSNQLPEFLAWRNTYKYPTRVLSVDMEEELKAGHCVEPASEMQFWAIADGAAARIDSSAVLVVSPIGDLFRLVRPVCLAVVMFEFEFDFDELNSSRRSS